MRDRALERLLSRRKMLIQIWKYRGWLRGSELIGRTSVPLDGLLRKSTVSNMLQVYIEF